MPQYSPIELPYVQSANAAPIDFLAAHGGEAGYSLITTIMTSGNAVLYHGLNSLNLNKGLNYKIYNHKNQGLANVSVASAAADWSYISDPLPLIECENITSTVVANFGTSVTPVAQASYFGGVTPLLGKLYLVMHQAGQTTPYQDNTANGIYVCSHVSGSNTTLTKFAEFTSGVDTTYTTFNYTDLLKVRVLVKTTRDIYRAVSSTGTGVYYLKDDYLNNGVISLIPSGTTGGVPQGIQVTGKLTVTGLSTLASLAVIGAAGVSGTFTASGVAQLNGAIESTSALPTLYSVGTLKVVTFGESTSTDKFVFQGSLWATRFTKGGHTVVNDAALGGSAYTIDFATSNVFIFNLTNATTGVIINLSTTLLYQYIGGTFCVLVSNNGSDTVDVGFNDTFSNVYFKGIAVGVLSPLANCVRLAAGESLAYTGVIGVDVTRQVALYGNLNRVCQNLAV